MAVSFEEFCRFVAEQTGFRREIARTTDIGHDLGVAGIDGENFADALFRTYGLKLDDDEVARHFGPEQAATPWSLLMWFMGRYERLPPLTVGEVYDRICRLPHAP